jgi:2-polyprenyl-3-methyl-5-hydroxy-6-metoxy-1,4-benzoquinol methylase
VSDAGRDDEIVASWVANADAWTRAVRSSLIPSRVAGTDQAILEAVRRHRPRTVLDAGCGEGWLARALAAEGYAVRGIDASAPLVDRAREQGGAEYDVVSYDAIIDRPEYAGGPYDVIALNFALFAEHVAPLLRALATRLDAGGVMIIQTLHPWAAAEEPGYVDGWRVATFAGFGGPFPEPMPWYFRTLATWSRELAAAGLGVVTIDEPRHAGTGQPLSMLVTARRLRV